MKRIIIIAIVLLLIPFVSYGTTDEYLNRLPTEIVSDYHGTIRVVDEMPKQITEQYPYKICGVIFWDSYDIYVLSDYPEVLLHETGHYIYYSTEWSMDIAKVFSELKADYEPSPCYQDLDRYHYDSEIFAELTEMYYTDFLGGKRKELYEQLINLILEQRRLEL